MIDQRNTLEKDRQLFAFVNMEEIFDDNTEYHEVKKKIKSIDNYISMNEIIANCLFDTSTKHVFKLRSDETNKIKPLQDLENTDNLSKTVKVPT